MGFHPQLSHNELPMYDALVGQKKLLVKPSILEAKIVLCLNWMLHILIACNLSYVDSCRASPPIKGENF